MGPGAGLLTVNVAIPLSLAPSTETWPKRSDVVSRVMPPALAWAFSSASSFFGFVRRCRTMRPTLSLLMATAQLTGFCRATCSKGFSSAADIRAPAFPPFAAVNATALSTDCMALPCDGRALAASRARHAHRIAMFPARMDRRLPGHAVP
jgi:hypothetical protein